MIKSGGIGQVVLRNIVEAPVREQPRNTRQKKCPQLKLSAYRNDSCRSKRGFVSQCGRK